MKNQDIITLAESHGLGLRNDITFNEMGIDFKVAFAKDLEGKPWVLRIPRREGLGEQIVQESKILDLAKKHLSIAVPEWIIASPELIAYPLLVDMPMLTYDAQTYEVTWHVDQNSPNIIPSLARTLVDLHNTPMEEAKTQDIKHLSPEMQRQEILDRLEAVKRELGMKTSLEKSWRAWLDDDKLWPDYSVFVHGDLYAGHILTKKDGTVSGFIDWSEGQFSDPSMDFSGHANVFGEDSLKSLISEYEKMGGRVWDHMYAQAIERNTASPLNYGYFAITTKIDEHLQAAKQQLV
ncbi:macrolide 2'-phosphotransferase [Litoribacter populi]|uniref:macrolide 2'-phosphotransferase n=1 Tax=Litoribacter populi TaxID=2598460 RepID=UPI00117D3CE3|nr:macrolide 2'-phosphotransferase [Litoribacter populi]